MEMPKLYDFVELIATITCVIGCIAGIIGMIGGLTAFDYSFAAGFAAISGGIYLVLGSLFGLGITYSFLAIVQAQVETRNALINYVESKLADAAAEKNAQTANRVAPQGSYHHNNLTAPSTGRQRISTVGMKKCPECSDYVESDATTCRHCKSAI